MAAGTARARSQVSLARADEDAEVDETYAKNLIANVIKNMDDNDHVEKVVEDLPMPVQIA